MIVDWMNVELTERERKEIEFCQVYATQFQHGTDGHNIRMLVAKLVGKIYDLQHQLEEARGSQA